MDKDLRLGVIGASGRGQIALSAHKPGQGSRVAACCDNWDVAIAWARRTYGESVTIVRDYRELLDMDLDAVFVCTPDFLHEEHACAVLERGIACYLEKPMAITIAGCDRILSTAKEHGAKLFVGHNMRYMNIIRKMKKLVDDGAIGAVKSVWCRHFLSGGGSSFFRDWHAEQRYSTGLLLQKGAHDIDVMHWIAGATSRRVSAFGNLAVYGRAGKRESDDLVTREFRNRDPNGIQWPPLACSGFNPRMNVEDQTVMIMEMDRDVLGCYLECHFTPDACRNYTVIGTEGRLENLGDEPDSPIMLWNRLHKNYRIIGDEVHYGDTTVEGGHGGADPWIVAEFLDYVRHGAPTTATPQAARDAVAAGYQATLSLRAGGQAMDVPRLPEHLANHRY